jgi:hypothetical protein
MLWRITMASYTATIGGMKDVYLTEAYLQSKPHLSQVHYVYTYPDTLEVGMVYEVKISNDEGAFVPGHYRVNPYVAHRDDIESEEVSVSMTYSADGVWEGKYSVDGDIYLYAANRSRLYLPTPDFSTLNKIALQKAFGKVAKADLALGEDLGEIRETLQMLRSPLKGLRDFLRDGDYNNVKLLRKLLNYQKTGMWLPGKTKPGAALKTAADTWMEVRYGLRPLLYTLQDVMAFCAKTAQGKFNPDAIRSARGSATLNNNNDLDCVIAKQYGPLAFTYVLKNTDVLTSYASVQYRQDFALTGADQFGLTPRFLPELAWELTRLSFVVDWLFTIGPWLESYRFKPGITVLGNTVGMKLTRNCAITARHRLQIAPFPEGGQSPGSGKYVAEEYDRVVNLDIPILPQFTAGRTIDLFRTIDGLALILQPVLKKLKG